MSTNISKQKREDLLAKIKEIRTFISAAPQDENTGNLLSYLSDLEKDVNGKKYGLVFEEHREEIDEVLDTHTPVLTEDKDLYIDNGGQMNCPPSFVFLFLFRVVPTLLLCLQLLIVRRYSCLLLLRSEADHHRHLGSVWQLRAPSCLR